MFENQEWLNFNRNRRYPFKTGTTGGTSPNKIPNEVFLDLKIVGIPFGEKVFLSKYKKLANKIQFTFSTDQTPNILVFDITYTGHIPFKTYTTTNGNYFGIVALGDLTELLKFGAGAGISYNLSEAEIEFSCIQYELPEVVTSISTPSSGTLLTGPVELRVGPGLEIQTLEDSNAVLITLANSISGDCECPPNFPFIRTINGIAPDCSGNFCVTAGGINTVMMESACLKIDSMYQPNQICSIGVGIPGPQGPEGIPGPGCDCSSLIEGLDIDISNVSIFVSLCCSSLTDRVTITEADIDAIYITQAEQDSVLTEHATDITSLDDNQSCLDAQICNIRTKLIACCGPQTFPLLCWSPSSTC